MKLSILLASFGPQSQRFLNLCFKSLEAQTYCDFEIIHVSSGEFKPESRATKHIHDFNQLHYPSAIAEAYKQTDPASDFILFLNDDVILNKNCINAMLAAISAGPFMVNCMSNCDDNGRFYLSGMPYKKLKYSIEEMESLCDGVINMDHITLPNFVFQGMCHLYCTMLRRSDYEKIGKIDEIFRTGFDDRCLSIRARKHGIIPGFFTSAYALHASGSTADLHLSNEDRQFNEEYFKSKYQG